MNVFKERGRNYVRGLDKPLLLSLAIWYIAHYYYTFQNQAAANAVGGGQFSMLLATSELIVGASYAIFLWIAPYARPLPAEMTLNDITKLAPAGMCIAGLHAATVFSSIVGGVTFSQIVKSSEPAFVAAVGALFYGKQLSVAKWVSLLPIIGGVVLCAIKQNQKGEFEWSYTPGALFGALVANIFAAFRVAESHKVLGDTAVLNRLGGVGNQFAVMMIIALHVMIPLAVFTEGHQIQSFVDLLSSCRDIQQNVILAGLTFYLYNELSNMTLRKLSPVANSVTNVANRAVAILAASMVFQEKLTGWKALGSAVCLGGVFLHSIIDDLVEALKKQKVAKE